MLFGAPSAEEKIHSNISFVWELPVATLRLSEGGEPVLPGHSRVGPLSSLRTHPEW
jgi:hypothetical protein